MARGIASSWRCSSHVDIPQNLLHCKCHLITSQGFCANPVPSMPSYVSLLPNAQIVVVTFMIYIAIFSGICIGVKDKHNPVFLNKWAVNILGGEKVANLIANQYGFISQGVVGSLPDYYLFENHKVVKRSIYPAEHHHHELNKDPKVLWVEQQRVHKRVKRDFTLQDGWRPHLIDPQWPQMWYLHGGASGDYDMRVIEAWQAGYSGKGVVVTILDDGIEHTHPDLMENYDTAASKDINGEDKDPMPRYNTMDENRHGTRCAGEVAAVANNTLCAVGIAYKSNIGGVRMLDGDVSDYIEAQALSLNPQHIDIYSASWGPDDNGMVVDGPAKLAREAFLYGILQGRAGKGSIYVWASGNGGANSDSCSCDGYTNSIFTLSVSSASEHGKKPWYLEECSSTLATTYSSGDNYGERKIVTTDLHSRCTESHTGTSASAPLAAAMCSLALQANPDLTWRDMQYVVMMSARAEPLNDGDWVVNGAGRKVSHKYGYGLMDGLKMVQLAERWSTVPPQHICQSTPVKESRQLDGLTVLSVKIEMDACADTDNVVNFLEHVQAKVTLSYSRRGSLLIHLVSPNGTRSTLLPERKKDIKHGEFNDWPFMSVFYWGESPRGTWTLQLENIGSSYNSGTLVGWQLILYGTETYPVNLINNPKYPPSKPSPDKATINDALKDPIEITEDGSTVDNMVPQESEYIEYDHGHKNGDKVGLSCHYECDPSAGCWGTHADACEICRHMRLGIDGMCVKECPGNTYLTEDMNVCLPCPSTCSSCVGPDPEKDCRSCIFGLYFIPHDGACLRECPNGMYPDRNNSCVLCADTCEECEHVSDHCLVCVKGYDLVDYKCLKTCTSLQFRDNHGRCVQCDSSCETCSGDGPSHCLLCPSNYSYDRGFCVEYCQSGYYRENTQQGLECRRCHPSCASCFGLGVTHCLECNAPRILVDGKCEEHCPEGWFESDEGICLPCQSSCTTCQGPHADDCLSCSINMLLEFGHCVFRCQDGYFEYVTLEHTGEMARECRSCDRNCQSCDGDAPANCTVCKDGLLLSNKECVHHCDTSDFQVGRTCLECALDCRTCVGAGSDNCTSCRAGLSLFHSQCLTSCPSDHYTHQMKCHPCHISCTRCYDGRSNTCLACKAGLILTTDGQCVQSRDGFDINDCGDHMFYNPLDGECHRCDVTCRTCNGPGPNHCLSCVESLILYKPKFLCLPCCSANNHQQCCTCDTDTDLCVEYHDIVTELLTYYPPYSTTTRNNLPVTEFPRHENPVDRYPETDTTSDDENSRSHASPLWPGFVSTIVCLCILIILLFLVVFGLLQAKSNEKLCWRSRYAPVPTIFQNSNGQSKKVFFKNGTSHIPSSAVDFASEDDDEDTSSG